MKVLRGALATLSVFGALALSMVAGAAPAQALPTCSISAEGRTSTSWWYWPAAANGDVNCVMGRGNQGAAVRSLQSALNRCHGQGLSVDGVYGPATEQAVRNVQAAGGIAQDGVYGPQTRSRMRWFTYPAGYCAGHG